MSPELQRGASQDGANEQQPGKQQVDPETQIVEIKLTADHCALILAVLHYMIEESGGLNEDQAQELRALATFFAAVTLEPWKFPAQHRIPLHTLPGDSDVDRWEGEGGA